MWFGTEDFKFHKYIRSCSTLIITLQQSVDDTASAAVNSFLLSRFKWRDSSLGIQVHTLLTAEVH